MTLILGLKNKVDNLLSKVFKHQSENLDLTASAKDLRAQVLERLLLTIALFMIPINALVTFMTPNISFSDNLYATFFGCVALLGLRGLVKQGRVSLVARILSTVFVAIPMLMLYSMGTVNNLLITYFLLSIIISSFLLSERMTFLYAGITIFGSITLYYLEQVGGLPEQNPASTGNQIILFIVLVILITTVFKIESINRKKLKLALSRLENELIERTKVEQQLSHTALHDGLTHLPNRSLLKHNLNNAILESKADPEKRFALLYLDLDRFKNINDSMGHAVGDSFLIEFGKRLTEGLRSHDTVARLGGDEFVILLADIKNYTDAIKVAERILDFLDSSIRINGKAVNVSASIGISYSKLYYNHADEVLRDADIAMYQSKSTGRNIYTIYDNNLQQKVSNRLELENDLPTALENQEFILHYQPIIDLKSNTISGFEALVRWQHPRQGLVNPNDFIPIAEETGAIRDLNMYVLETAAKQFQIWKDSHPFLKEAYLSINTSTICIETPFYAQKVTRLMRDIGFDTQYLAIEITEGLLINNIEKNIHVLEKLKSKGIRISIDDFGTGYSSLSYLHRLPVDNIKIDKSFVIGMKEGNKNQSIIETIISLAKRLDMNLIAEGIETPEQLETLQNLNCDHGQGFFFTKALSVENIPEYLNTLYIQNCKPIPQFSDNVLAPPSAL